MIISKKNDIAVFEFLVEKYYKCFSIEELSKETGLSVPKLYRTVKLLSKYLLVRPRKTSNYVKIDTGNIFVTRFKLLKDAEKILQLKEPFSNKLGWAKTGIFTSYKETVKSIIIFGSLASGEYNKESDIDLLIIRKDGTEELDLSFINFEGHLIQKTVSELNEDFYSGDDFLISILKNNIIWFDYDDTFYNLLTNELPQPKQELTFKREKQVEELRRTLFTRLRNKDKKESVDCFKRYLLLSSRLELLRYAIRYTPILYEYIPTTKNNVLELISKLQNRDLKKVYDSVNEKNIREMVEKYV